MLVLIHPIELCGDHLDGSVGLDVIVEPLIAHQLVVLVAHGFGLLWVLADLLGGIVGTLVFPDDLVHLPALGKSATVCAGIPAWAPPCALVVIAHAVGHRRL